MYNYYRPQQQTPALLKGHPVASFDEARAASIDFDGSIFFFPDMVNKKIYTKQINIDGTLSLNMYELKEIEAPKMEEYVTRTEFERVLQELKAAVSGQPIAEPAQPQPEFKF